MAMTFKKKQPKSSIEWIQPVNKNFTKIIKGHKAKRNQESDYGVDRIALKKENKWNKQAIGHKLRKAKDALYKLDKVIQSKNLMEQYF